MRFQVKSQYGKGFEDIIAEFKNQPDAECFIKGKLNEAIRMKIHVTYSLYDSTELVAKYNADEAASGTSGSASSVGQAATAAFRPTPLNTRPTPAGLPKNWWQDEDEEKQK